MESRYSRAIAVALRQDLRNVRGATKIVMQWTGARERTAKNWFSGSKGPSGEHLVGLVRNSDAVLFGLLELSGRTVDQPAQIALAREKLKEATEALDRAYAPTDGMLSYRLERPAH